MQAPISILRFRKELAATRARWNLLTFYEKFEHLVILVLSTLIALVVALAVWNLTVKIVVSLFSTGLDPTDYAVFQALFGMIFTVIIALEFKRSLLLVADRRHSVVQVRTVLLIALLAIVRKLMILDLATTDAPELFALAAAVLALGAVFWLVREQDRRDTAAPADDRRAIQATDNKEGDPQ
jgi:uncharacterized membrane protein (DUF373 family)